MNHDSSMRYREINAKLDGIQGALKKEGYDVTQSLHPKVEEKKEEPKKQGGNSIGFFWPKKWPQYRPIKLAQVDI